MTAFYVVYMHKHSDRNLAVLVRVVAPNINKTSRVGGNTGLSLELFFSQKFKFCFQKVIILTLNNHG